MCTVRKVCYSWNCFGCMAKYILIFSSSHFSNRYQIEKQYFKCGFTSKLKMNGKESLPGGVSDLLISPTIPLAFFTLHMCVEHLSLLSIIILRFLHYINWLMSFSSFWLGLIDNVSFTNKSSFARMSLGRSFMNIIKNKVKGQMYFLEERHW